MKTLDEATKVLSNEFMCQGYDALVRELGSNPHVLKCLLQVACLEMSEDSKYFTILAMGMVIGMEMEKP